jgi:hypothetical protein
MTDVETSQAGCKDPRFNSGGLYKLSLSHFSILTIKLLNALSPCLPSRPFRLFSSLSHSVCLPCLTGWSHQGRLRSAPASNNAQMLTTIVLMRRWIQSLVRVTIIRATPHVVLRTKMTAYSIAVRPPYFMSTDLVPEE